MTADSSQRLISTLKSFSKYTGLIVAAVGGSVLYGWIFDIQPLKSILPGFATMKANTASGFILSGLGLWFLSEETAGRKKRWIIAGCAAAVALLGLFTSAEHIFGLNFGIDQLIARDLQTPAASHPGRMSLTTAANFALLGIALLLLDVGLRWSFRPAQILTLLAGAIATVALIGYLYGVESLYSVEAYSSMALHTALSFALLSMGLLCARPQQGLMEIVSTESTGGVILRRLFPIAVIVLIVIGWLRLWGQRAGLYDTSFGVALTVMLSITALGIVIWLSAGWLNRVDADRRRAVEVVRDSEERYRSLFENMLDGYAYCKMLFEHGQPKDFVYIDVNPAFETLTGLKDVAGRRVSQVIPGIQESNPELFVIYGRVASTGRPERFETYLPSLGIWFSISVFSPKAEHFVAVFDNITERKEAEQALRQAEAQYRSLVEQLPMIVYINSNKDITETTYVGPQIQTILGYTPEEWLADPKSWQKALHPDDRQFVLEKVESINLSGEPFDMEFRMTARNGRVVWFRDQAVLIRDSTGQPLYWQGLMINISESKQRERELEAIAALSSALREIRSTDEILLHLLSEALTSVNAKHGGIWLYDPDRDEISLAYEIGLSVKLPTVIKRGEGIIGLAFESGDVVISDDLQKDERIAEQLRELVPAGLSAVCVPLRSADNLVGAMLITNESPREFASSDIRILTALSQIGGSAIHRTTLNEQTVNQLGRLAALRAIDIAITSSLDLKLTLNVVLDQVVKQLNVDAADILLLKPDLQILEFASGKGFKTQSFEASSLRLGEGQPGRAALNREALFVGNLQTESAFKRRKLLEDEKFISYYAAPLIAKGKVKGVLEIFHRSALIHDPGLVQFLEALADQAAIAIDNSALFYDLQRSNIDLSLAYDATIEGWSRALDLRDKETEGHTQRVTEVALKLAHAMGVSDEQLVHIRRGALLHDIGKMGVPDGILLKPDKLTEEEWEVMRKHPVYAYEMLMPIAYLRAALDIPYCHHEKWDGTGYPRGLRGEQIPLSARIFAVVDVWDALRSNRPYRAGWENEMVLNYLREQSGKHFDPRVVEKFLGQVVSSE